MHYFQDIHTWFMHSLHKGNDEIPEKYGSAWVYTRYLVSLSQKIDYTDQISLQAWMEPYSGAFLHLPGAIESAASIAVREWT